MPTIEHPTAPHLKAIKDFHQACHIVLSECPNQYAKSYANAGLTLDTPSYVYAQCLYLRGNMGDWKGKTARETKLIIDRVTAVLRPSRYADREHPHRMTPK